MNHRLIITLPDGVEMSALSRHAERAGFPSASAFIGAAIIEKLAGPVKSPETCIAEIEKTIKKFRK